MNLKIPRVHGEIRLAEYAPEFEDVVVQVWLNPPRALLLEWDEISKAVRDGKPDADELNQRMNAVLAELWGWPVEDVHGLEENAKETDPGLLGWMVRETFSRIVQHRLAVKKN